MEASSLEIKLKRVDRIFRSGDTVEGSVLVIAKGGWAHKGVSLVAEGHIYLSTNRGAGMINDGTNRSVQILKHDVEVAGAGRFADGPTEIPFSFTVTNREIPLTETYHGVYISVIYNIHVECERGILKKTLSKDMEFIVEVPTGKSSDPSPASFDITPESLENVNSSVVSTIPRFQITGRLHKSNFPINQPFTGEVVIQSADVPIRSLELQLVRVETVILDGKTLREATEIQNIQIGEGNICRGIVVPMYMVFPRLFACPSNISPTFKIEFEVNLIVVFGEGYMITENFPISLSREC